jgi:hypothetical protein
MEPITFPMEPLMDELREIADSAWSDIRAQFSMPLVVYKPRPKHGEMNTQTCTKFARPLEEFLTRFIPVPPKE